MRRLALLFPGQAPISLEIISALCERVSGVEEFFADAEDILETALRGASGVPQGSQIDQARHQQLLLVTYQLALLRTWHAINAGPPVAVSGHSLGQVAALVASEALSEDVGLRFIMGRAKAMGEAAAIELGSTILVSGLPIKVAEHVCRHTCARLGQWWAIRVANYNASDQTVLSGNRLAIMLATQTALALGAISVQPLPVAMPAHTPFMDSAARRLVHVVERLAIGCPQLFVVSNIDGLPIENAESVRRELVEGIINPVRWVDCVRMLDEQGIDSYVELSSRPILCKLILKIIPTANVTTFFGVA